MAVDKQSHSYLLGVAEAEIARLRLALATIADGDYRGNRHPAQQIAFEALYPDQQLGSGSK